MIVYLLLFFLPLPNPEFESVLEALLKRLRCHGAHELSSFTSSGRILICMYLFYECGMSKIASSGRLLYLRATCFSFSDFL